jgi:hypothetical protein
MRKLVPLLVLLAGCGGTMGDVTVSYSDATWGGNDTAPWEEGRPVDDRVLDGRIVDAQAVVVKPDSSSTTDFGVTIEQPEAPPVMGRQDTLHLAFVITVRNLMKEPATIKRLTLQNAGSNFDVDTVSRPFDVTIEPGAVSKFELVARATGIDPNVGTDVPMTVRAVIDSVQNKSRKRASFVRSINGRVAVGVSQ